MLAAELILASGSPRRRELLTQAGFAFEIDVADTDEELIEGEAPDAATSRLAMEKAEAVVARRAAQSKTHPQWILAADTTVVIAGRILGKPTSSNDAVEMLLSLSGRNHDVLTAWALLPIGQAGAQPEAGITCSTVRMREISRREAEAYAATGEPMDKAGSYAAQGEGRRFIGAIHGPLDNVIGLPMTPVAAALARGGVFPTC